MKTLAFLFLALTANFAQAAEIRCQSAYDLGEDRHVGVVIQDSRDEALVLNRHESTLTAARSQIVRNGNSIAVLSQTLRGNEEDSQVSVQVDALLIYRPQTRTMEITLWMDGSKYPVDVLRCR